MVDRFGRPINTLRIAVTDRCNLCCTYCRPSCSVKLLPREEILSLEEIAEVARAAVGLGVSKVRITGGEPLVRRDLHLLVGMLSRIDGIRELTMTTNGSLLAEEAARLASAGLQRVNISLDAIDPASFSRITRGGDVRDVLTGIVAARSAGLTPIKLNCVVAESSDEPDARDVARFAQEAGLTVRFIRQMDLAGGSFAVVQGGTGGDCRTCGRLRLTADGVIRPCLFSDIGVRVRELGAADALRQAIALKPEAGTRCSSVPIYAIGG